MTLQLTSPAFKQGELIPSQYTCDGANISPKLVWNTPPEGTKCLALIVDDPDAPSMVWVHWVLYNIPENVRELPENVPHTEKLSDGTVQGVSDFRQFGYGGPCPPSGTHRYFFKLFALDSLLSLPPKATKEQLEKAMKGHILAQTELMGRYERQKK